MKKLHLILLCCLLPGIAFAQPNLIPPNKDIPTPESILGFQPGADFKLATYKQSIDYFQALAASSELIQLRECGKTSEGRVWYYSVISSKENLDKLGTYLDISQQLAHPGELSREAAWKLAQEGKAIVHIDGGLHASEVAGTQHTIQLAYDIISQAEGTDIQNILDKVILLLWPSLNPDGQDIVANWYASNVGTPYEVSSMPMLYQKYIGHDNNRDAYMNNMIESRVVARTWRQWEPQIIHVHHQSSPFPTRIWLPPFAEPIASQAPPLISREINTIGMAIAQALETKGQVGAVHMGTGFDAWYPGYIDYLPVMQNIAAYWTETALYRYATPYFYTMRDFPQDRKDLRTESLYNSPWKGGWWRLRDAVEYMLTASLAVLDYAAKYKETLLFNRYQAGMQAIEKYEQEPPYAYFIPQQQRDPVRPVELLRRLAFNGIHIAQLNSDISYEGRSYPKGTWVIPMNQEYAELARQILDVQTYPDLREFPEGPPEQPYDAAGWTLPYLFEVDMHAAASPLSEEILAALEPVQGEVADWQQETEADQFPDDAAPGLGFHTNATAAGILPPPGKISGSGGQLLLDPTQNNTFRAINRALKGGGRVSFLQDQGQYLISGVASTRLQQWVQELALQARWTTQKGNNQLKGRIGLYRPWTASMDEGWTRWLLEQYEFEFAHLRNSDFHAGGLIERFDVILMASDRPNTIEHGFSNSVPPRYQGGLGVNGQQQLDEFVRQGGTLVCMNQSSEYAITALHLPVKNVVKGISRKDFFTGGSILGIEPNPAHPIMAGMPSRANIFVWRSPVFTTLEGFEGSIMAKYQAKGSPLRSGYLLGEKHLNGYAAAVDVHHGNGHVILLGFRPQWRGQTFGTFRLLFNSVLLGKEYVAVADGNNFWAKPNH